MGAREAITAGDPVTFIVRDVTRPPELCTELENSVDAATFRAATEAGQHALSWSAHESVQYAIPRASLDAALTATPPQRIVLNVSRSICDDVLREYGPVADVYVMLISASAEALRARLRTRGREDEAAIEQRVAKATAYERPRATLGHKVLRVLNDSTPVSSTPLHAPPPSASPLPAALRMRHIRASISHCRRRASPRCMRHCCTHSTSQWWGWSDAAPPANRR